MLDFASYVVVVVEVYVAVVYYVVCSCACV